MATVAQKLNGCLESVGLWFGWAMGAYVLFFKSDLEYMIKGEGSISVWLIFFSVWSWCTASYIRRKNILAFLSSKLKVPTDNKREFKFLPFLIKNIVAPILVSLVIYAITGQASITIISVPIIGFLTANLNVG